MQLVKHQFILILQMIISNIKKIIVFLLLIPISTFAFSSNDITYGGAKKINGVNLQPCSALSNCTTQTQFYATKINGLNYSSVYIASSSINGTNYSYWHPTLIQSSSTYITTSLYPPTVIINSIITGLGNSNAYAISSINDTYISTSTINTSTLNNVLLINYTSTNCWISDYSSDGGSCSNSHIGS